VRAEKKFPTLVADRAPSAPRVTLVTSSVIFDSSSRSLDRSFTAATSRLEKGAEG
jgi:hypothetical protein